MNVLTYIRQTGTFAPVWYELLKNQSIFEEPLLDKVLLNENFLRNAKYRNW